ncbi:NAD(P)/FAD-dependent oxidoreductase [Trueperella pecoris]|uniref:NADH:ubiquinone reductase (non-electrogenic) n=1 Tax=Trueperella pecoris TaxID=2733571 RepID=A0A7M1R162_9ACTO|nr:NAD(P)/FAD-dependent oxidoreductase [Trueperella pecoris]QOR48062.1 NAD(P)/FAD-dependent oxidoreductase [Trueperella pecoris]
MAQHRVVIVGSGFAGLKVAQQLKKADVSITLIAKTSHHLFQPLLYQVATGILSEGDIAPTTREILQRQKNVQVRLGLVEDIDVEQRKVLWRNHNTNYETPYDTLILAAGAGQSYFGNDHYAVFAPGMKNIDDALEIRARIFDVFEKAENETDPEERAKLLTFAVVGAGPTGVEMAGQIRELASQTLRHEFRNIDPADARVILIDGAEYPLPAFGPKLGNKTRKELERLGIDVVMNTIVTHLDKDTLTMKNKDGEVTTLKVSCKVWAAGVQASELSQTLAKQTGVELDRAGRVVVEDDLTVAGHPEIFVLGDMMSVPGVPGVAQGAIQSAKFAARVISARLSDSGNVAAPTKFVYRDKGSMATIARFKAVVKMGKLEFTGFFAWLSWCFLHLLYIVGFKSQVGTLLSWFTSFMSNARSERTTTNQQLVGRLALEQLGSGSSGKLVAGEGIVGENVGGAGAGAKGAEGVTEAEGDEGK